MQDDTEHVQDSQNDSEHLQDLQDGTELGQVSGHCTMHRAGTVFAKFCHFPSIAVWKAEHGRQATAADWWS